MIPPSMSPFCPGALSLFSLVSALAIAVVGSLVMCLLGVFGLTIGGGFGGAVISVITIAVVFWLVGWVVSLFT